MTLLKTFLLAATAALSFAITPTAHAQRVDGAGATFPQPLYNKWIEEYTKANPAAKLSYGGEGSGAGIKKITDRVVHFGASDAPLTEAQEKAANNKSPAAKILHLPTVAGPAVMIFNLEKSGIKKVKLNGDLIADIYLGKIKRWNDPKFASLNPGVTFPNIPLLSVHRSDGSGTSYIFTDYLSKVNKEWDEKFGPNTAPDWPTGLGGKGSDGVTAAVKASEGALGYVEFAYAKKNNLTFATMVNKDGKEVEPTIAAVLAAAAAVKFPADLKVSITNSPGADSYPISGFTYLLIYEDLTYMKDKAVALETVKFILWCQTDGQKFAEELGYAKLPKDAQDQAVAKLKTVKFDGQPLLK